MPPSPKVIVPRQSSETNKPVLPNFLLRMLGSLEFVLGSRGRRALPHRRTGITNAQCVDRVRGLRTERPFGAAMAGRDNPVSACDMPKG
jgi:hypothetical protein